MYLKKCCLLKFIIISCLHIATTILCSSYFSSLDSHLNYAEELLQYFVSNFKEIYGEHHISLNVHNLLHIVDDVRHFGPLDRFSCFKFENFNQQIKKMIRKHEKPLQQISRRIHEFDQCST